MKYLLTKQKREDFIYNNGRYIEFKWTISRGRDTCGYNICSVYYNRDKIESCNGGGYDMKGTCLGKFITYYFNEYLKKLRARREHDTKNCFYGLTFYNKKTKKYQVAYTEGCDFYIDGACGFSSMERILEKIGFKLEYVSNKSDYSIYRLCVMGKV